MREAAQIDIEDMAPVKKPRAKKAELVKLEKPATPANPVATTDTAAVLGMIERIMVDPAASVERANQAFEFYQKVQADQARRAFAAAMAAAKAEFTPIIKKHLVEYGDDDKNKKKTSYKHEDLADISKVIDPILGEHGLSYRYRATSNLNEPIKVACVVEHRLGHSEETTLTAGADGSGGKNSIQAIGSTLSYLQRYTLRIALGIATGRDDDGKAADASSLAAEQIDTLFDLITETNSNLDQFLIAAKVPAFDAADERTIETVKAKLSEIKPSEFQRLENLLNAKKRKAVRS